MGLGLLHLANDLQLPVLNWECSLMDMVELADEIKYFVMYFAMWVEFKSPLGWRPVLD